MRCPSCDHDNRPDRRFCGKCGAALAAPCPSCGATNQPDEQFCGGCGERLQSAAPAIAVSRPAPETDAASPAGERRQLTVLFCDLVGSTALAEQLDAEDLRTVVRAYQEAAAGPIERHQGYIAQYLGDGLLVYFGYPQAHEDNAERAVRAGLDMLTALGRVNDTLGPTHGIRLAARVGIHTGPVVIGAMGGGARSEVLAIGDTTNIAARVQGMAEPDTVVITAATHRLVAGLFVVEDRGPQELKGVREPVTLYRVVQPSGVRSRLEVSAGRHTPIVGRQTELGVLADAWGRVVQGMGHTVLVQGEAGLGKSRLCYELRERLSGEPHTWLEVRCSPYTSGTAFRPVTELVEQTLAFQPADTPVDKLGKLSVRLTLDGFAAGEAVPLLAEWLGLPLSAGYTALEMNAALKRHKTLETLAAWNLKLGELQPMVVLVEDMQWCDASSLELFGRLVAQSATARVLLVGTARPEFTSPWPARSNLQTLTLSRLTRGQTREMIAAASARTLPEALVEQLVARADGIPLFAEELTQSVVEGGETAAAAIPMTLQDSLLARLDRLSSAKQVAQRAAVLGREFSYALVAAVAGMGEATLQQGLARLVEAELLFVRGAPPEATYTFKHALVQEAAYESLLRRTRQQLHGRVADVIAKEFSERAAAEPEVVARHAELAGRIDEAITLYQGACDQDRTRSAYVEAIRHVSQAIALLGTQPESGERDAREAALQLVLGFSLMVARGFTAEGVEAAFERARVLCEAVGEPRELGFALTGLAAFSHNSGQVERAGALATSAVTIAEQITDAALKVRGHAELGTVEVYRGRFASSLAHFEAALALYEPGRRHLLMSNAHFSPADRDLPQLANSVLALLVLGWPDRALARAREATALARRIDHPPSQVFALFYETLAHQMRRDASAQRDRAAQLVALSETYGLPFWLGLGRTCHAAARVAGGELEAVADLLPGLVQSGGSGYRGGAPGLFVIVADAYLTAGQLTEARGAVETGLTLAAQTREPFMDAELHRLHGETVLRTVDSAESRVESQRAAEECFRRALDIARTQEAKSFELRAATSVARLWQEQGRKAQARELLAPVYAWFTEGFDTRDLQDAETLLEGLR